MKFCLGFLSGILFLAFLLGAKEVKNDTASSNPGVPD